MILSLIIGAFLLYVAFNTVWNGSRFETWHLCCIAALCLASWQSALVMLAIATLVIFQGVKKNEIRTLSWIEDLIK